MGNAYRSVLAGGGAGTPITPSNLSPANMEQGETYTPTANGKAVESVTDIMPSNSNPPALSAGNIYMPGSSGYAIGSYSNISPSSSGTYFSSGMKKMSSSGYAYSSKPSSGIRLRQFKARFTASRGYAFMYFDTSGKSTVSVGTLQSQASASLKFYNSSNVLIGTTISVTSNGSYTIPDGSSYCEFAVSTGTSGSNSYGLSDINIS